MFTHGVHLGGERFMIGVSSALRRVIDQALRVAPTNATVLISGETGSGKELVARLIHRAGIRRDKPLVVFHCGSAPEALLESELFGYERGAFTGATRPHAGLFERSAGGTLLLDEVGNISPAAQAKLLRVLQERRISRLGGTVQIETDVRVLATTQHDLRKLAARGRFREDLFYRLNVFPVYVPPLRARREDIALLVDYFLEESARRNRCRKAELAEDALAALICHHWPGNVRELQATLERCQLIAQSGAITLALLPAEIRDGCVPPRQGETYSSLAYAQRLMIARALHQTHWDYAKAAEALGLSRPALRQLVTALGLTRE